MLSTNLSPPQVLFLQAPSKIKIEDTLSSIFRDLTIRRIWNVIKFNRFPNDRSRKTQKYFMFVKGENYEDYEPAIYEKGFLNPLNDISQVQAKILTNFVLKKYSMPSGFIAEKIYSSLHKDGYVNSYPLLKSFGYYRVSKKGKEVVNELNNFLKTQEEKLELLIDGDKGEFINAINETGTYTFYFEKSNPKLYKNIISMVKRINRTKPFGYEHDLSNFMEAINIDLGYFTE